MPDPLRPNIRWIELSRLRPKWSAAGRTFFFSPAAIVAVYDALPGEETAKASLVPVFFRNITEGFASTPAEEAGTLSFSNVKVEGDGNLWAVTLGIHFHESGDCYLTAREDWMEGEPSAPENLDRFDPWLSRGALAHERLRALLLRSTEEQFSPIFLEVLLLLSREQLPLKNGEATDTKSWLWAQLDQLWVVFGAKNPRRWALETALLFARVSGPALLEFIECARAPVYKADRGTETAALLLAEEQGTVRLEEGGLVAVPDKPERLPIAPAGGLPPLHRSQKSAYKRCVALARLHFSGLLQNNPLQPRTFPFLIGPTGCGKSHVCRAVATALEAHFLPLTFGRWSPNGARDARPSMFTVLDALRKHPRVVVFLDEMDKAFSPRDSSGWERSCLNEIFALLDRQLPTEDFEIYERYAAKRDGEKLEKKAAPIDQKRLWVIGAGTWQSLTNPTASSRRSIGFSAAPTQMDREEKILAGVRDGKAIPEELLARFHADPILIDYPKADEIPEVLRTFGIADLAVRAGVDLSGHKFDFSIGGMRVLEALASDLALKIQAAQTPASETA